LRTRVAPAGGLKRTLQESAGPVDVSLQRIGSFREPRRRCSPPADRRGGAGTRRERPGPVLSRKPRSERPQRANAPSGGKRDRDRSFPRELAAFGTESIYLIGTHRRPGKGQPVLVEVARIHAWRSPGQQTVDVADDAGCVVKTPLARAKARGEAE